MTRGFAVECLGGSTCFETWHTIQAVRHNDGKLWQGLWVQERGGLGAWFSPSGARCRVKQQGE